MISDASYRLDGQVGIVTGSANGIGKELAIGLAAAGAAVVVADLGSQTAAAQDTAERIRAAGGEAQVVSMDITDLASIEAGIEETLAHWPRLDFLVNNAGTNIRKPILEYTEQDWDRINAVNLKGTFFCTQRVARRMVEQGHGRVVNIASQLAVVAMHDRSIYAITKAAVAHMAKTFALELGPKGIAVNAVGPTFVSTPMTTSMFTDQEFIQENLPRIPSGRFGTPSDVLGAVRFLLSPAAELINGALLLVDGGYTIW